MKDTAALVKEAMTDNEYTLDDAISLAENALVQLQHEEGYWLFDLEADCTITSEYILMMHYMDEVDELLQAKIAHYLRGHQNVDGSYPLFTGGPGDISCTVKVYYALKMAGDKTDRPHMANMRNYILSQGGAAKSNVFTRIMLATFEQIPWRGTPFSPVEIMLFPKWFPFHLDKISYWSRTVMVPLLILCTFKAKARNRKQVNVQELFVIPPEQEKHYFEKQGALNRAFVFLDTLGRTFEPLIPNKMRQRATQKAQDWFVERLNGEDGLGAIFPAMVNVYEAMDLLGFDHDGEQMQTAKRALKKMLIISDHEAFCQPCLSPVWDTGLALLALQEADAQAHDKTIQRSFNWLFTKQLSDEPGDWRINRPDLEGGGWAFEFENPHYPDVDDTAVVAYSMAQVPEQTDALKESIRRATVWVAGMQSSNGGFAAFDVDNTCYYLNKIPFADHGALLDPPSADVSARCIMFLSTQLDQNPDYQQVINHCLDYIRREQEEEGCWFGRWGCNYIYGTWSVLVALEPLGTPINNPMVRKAVRWLKSVQREDGGWGESNYSFHDASTKGQSETSTACQTAWAVLGLMAAGEVDSVEVEQGVDYLLRTQQNDGFWNDGCFNAPGFPKVFYLKYHGYDKFFPLWALARYRNLQAGK